jgi:hypothetical protein
MKSTWNKNKHWSKEVREKIGLSLKGRVPWNKGKVGLMPPAWNKGKTMPEDVRAKISHARKGQSPWNKGKSWSQEVKQRISEAAKKRYADRQNAAAIQPA